MRFPLPASRRAALVVALVVPLLTAGSSWGREGFHRLRSDHDPVAEQELRRLEQVFSNAFNGRDARTLDRLASRGAPLAAPPVRSRASRS